MRLLEMKCDPTRRVRMDRSKKSELVSWLAAVPNLPVQSGKWIVRKRFFVLEA